MNEYKHIVDKRKGKKSNTYKLANAFIEGLKEEQSELVVEELFVNKLSLLLYNVDFCRCMLEKSEINGKMLFDCKILKRQLLLHVKSLCKRRIEYHE